MTNEKMLEIARKTINEMPGFIKHNNLQVEKLTSECCEMSVEITENSLNPHGIVHGGLLFGLADTTMGILARTSGRNAVTLNANIDYLKPGKGRKIICISEPLKIGKTTSVYRANLYTEDNVLISTVTGTFIFID